MDKKQIYEVGAQKVSEDLDIFNILQTLLKLKATVTVLVGEHAEMINRIQHVYYNNSTLFLDEADSEKYKESKT